MKKVLYLGAPVGAEAAAEVLAGRAELVQAPTQQNDAQDAVARALLDAAAVLDASMKVRLTDDMLAKAVNLEIISCATTGSDHIERGELDRRNIPVRTLKEDRELLFNITPAAELSFALLLGCARSLPAAVRHVKEGGWNRELFPGAMLNGKRLGIIGCGRIGSWMSRYAAAFGMECVGYDPYLETFPPGVTPLPLEELLATSHAVSLHVHLSDETRGLLSRERLALLKPGAIVINTSRGGLMDEDALLDALRSGQVGAIGLDVLAHEPDIADSPLWQYAREHDNCLITPHCGGFSPDAVRVVCARAAEKIAERLGL